ncbi:hypothetical protein BH10PAT3_BH10PAT3_2720 [soil metagenome]
MPSRNTIKEYEPQTYYHIYNRGVEKRNIFLDKQDYVVFLSYIKRHLGIAVVVNQQNAHAYPNYHQYLKLLAFCLMPNHFHMLIYQDLDETAITRLIRSVCTAYTMYFNKKYKRVGHLFQGRFKASRISSDAYVQHISRYIHMNPNNYMNYKWSSLPYYLSKQSVDWVDPTLIINMFNSKEEYFLFVKDYEGQKEILEELKHELAN